SNAKGVARVSLGSLPSPFGEPASLESPRCQSQFFCCPEKFCLTNRRNVPYHQPNAKGRFMIARPCDHLPLPLSHTARVPVAPAQGGCLDRNLKTFCPFSFFQKEIS